MDMDMDMDMDMVAASRRVMGGGASRDVSAGGASTCSALTGPEGAPHAGRLKVRVGRGASRLLPPTAHRCVNEGMVEIRSRHWVEM